MQAATIPGAFMGAPSEVGAKALTTGAGSLFGDVDKAGSLFNQVNAATKGASVPVTNDMYAAASRAMDLADTGAKGLPRVISKFMNRVTDPTAPPVDWSEARDFYSNVSRLSGNEYQNMNPQMARAVGQFAGAFNSSLRGVAQAAGVGDQYAQAMQMYAKAKGWQQFGSDVWTGMKKALPVAGGVGAGSLIGRKLSDLLTGE